MIWYNALFSFKGRLNRQGFWVGFLINFIFLFVCVNFLLNLTAYNALSLIPMAIITYSLSAIIVKRLHDRNRSGKAIFILLVPILCYATSLISEGSMQWILGLVIPLFVCTLLFLEWGLFQSYPEPNQYGEKGLSILFKAD
ncbi:DUF805 domain-containing protein [Mannheimia sp. AT1]|uniref:DUF805 domain-containing protein n=1 Tax=Mannheimia cairinae TaxID=3025936 RepID=A0ABT5MSD5_9PAST|nr:DUF805 domain-containing protein [Mannheimia cairinae]MDD0823763.1 DUF805 domain-containing protein [Mannheimia cairinae]MDD0825079.1 DUF805 domain-containing protein [Mannheimia cairinae]